MRNRSKTLPLFDHLVGGREQSRRDAETERLGGFEIDAEPVLVRLLDWQIGWLLALEDTIDVPRRQVEPFRETNTVAN